MSIACSRTGTDQMVVETVADRKIGFFDDAIAVMDQLESPKRRRARVTAAC